MSRIVMKFGGTSVGSIEKIKNVAEKVKKVLDNGNEVCVVVSAMSGVTNQLIEYINATNENQTQNPEYDSIVASGEQVTSGLLALALQKLGYNARSWLGWQLPIQTDSSYGRARIKEIKTDELLKHLKANKVAVIAGFQGFVGNDNRISTLGRGGSDTSAVAIAVAIDADCCDIYTDVDGVYTADPRIVPLARKLDQISHEEMLELASLGSKVLHNRSVEIAMKYNMPLRVLSSFNDLPGTTITSEDKIMEKQIVSGITSLKDEALITIVGLEDSPGSVANVFGPIAKNNYNVDMIVQTSANDSHKTDLTFTVPAIDMEKIGEILKSEQKNIKFDDILFDKNIVKVSIVGTGMTSHTGVANTMFQALADKQINIKSISTSEIKISVIIDKDYNELAIRTLHSAYGLDKKN